MENIWVYWSMLAIFLPCFLIKIWADLNSKFGVIIFLKIHHADDKTVEELKKCFKNAKCENVREFELNVTKNSAISYQEKPFNYNKALWISFESESHHDFIKPRITQRISDDKLVDSFDILSIKHMSLHRFLRFFKVSF